MKCVYFKDMFNKLQRSICRLDFLQHNIIKKIDGFPGTIMWDINILTRNIHGKQKLPEICVSWKFKIVGNLLELWCVFHK